MATKPTTSKKTTTKPATKAPAKKAVKTVAAQPVETADKKPAKSTGSYAVVSVTGEKTGSMALPTGIFGVPYNRALVSQAIRVFRTNQREGSAHTKTRGMVEGSTRKIYKQKGTGRARHGGIRAPIFVGGGITFGPQAHEMRRTLPKEMKKQALASVLSHHATKESMRIVDGMETLPVKTKAFAKMLGDIHTSGRTLVVYGTKTAPVKRAIRNIAHVRIVPFTSLTAYEVMTHASIVFAKDGLNDFIAFFKQD